MPEKRRVFPSLVGYSLTGDGIGCAGPERGHETKTKEYSATRARDTGCKTTGRIESVDDNFLRGWNEREI